MQYDEKKFGDKKSNGHKGFYLAISSALVCVMALGTVYYQMNFSKPDSNVRNQLASESASTVTPGNKTQTVGQGAIGEEREIAETQKQLVDTQKEQEKQKRSQERKKEKAKAKVTTEKSQETISNPGAVGTFDEKKGLLWPVKGDVLMKYSMKNTIYFKTLAQYQCNPAIEIAAKPGTKVKAAADGKITEIGNQDEYGKMVSMDIGSNYTVTYGQLKNIKVVEGQTIQEGDIIATVAEPTKFFAEEGSNLYFQVKEKKESVDPLLLLR